MPLDLRDQRSLLELARRSIADGCGHGWPPPAPQESWSPELSEPRATFVTLQSEGQLRGCRGTIEPKYPLAEDVWRNAWASAYADPRFPPVSAGQVARLDIAISMLTPLAPLPAASERELLDALRPGLDGLVLRCGAAMATFLPAVWDIFPDPREFVSQLKVKAGWSPSFWSAEVTVQRYQAETIKA